MKTMNRRGMLKLLGASTMSLGALTRPSFGAKPAPPPPSPPPVRYQINFWDYQAAPTTYSFVWDLNDAGLIVGSFQTPNGELHGFLYNSEMDAFLDLHDAYSPGAPIPNGWTIASGRSINRDGIIVGKLVEIGNLNGSPSLPFILDPRIANGFALLPDDFGPPGSTTSYLWINDNLDILTIYLNADGSRGAYVFNYGEYLLGSNARQPVPGVLTNGSSTISLNNPTDTRAAQVSGKFANGTVFRWTIGPDGGLENLPGVLAVRDINDLGVICGEMTKQGKQYPMRILGSTPTPLTSAPNHQAYSINNDGDVVLSSNATDLIYHNERGYFDLDKLVTGTPEDEAEWLAGEPFPSLLNNRDPITDFGQIAGRTIFPDGTQRGFILTPTIAP